MKRIRMPLMTSVAALLLACSAAVLARQGAGAEPGRQKPVPPTPAALQQFDGALVGTIEEIRQGTDFAGFVFRIDRVEPAPTSPPVDGRKLAGARVGLAVGESGPLSMGMLQSLDRFGPGHPVRAGVHAAGPRHLLYVQSMTVLPPGSVPTAAAPVTAPGGQSAGPDTRAMSAQLYSLRRDLNRLQREVAELRAMAQEIEAQKGRR